MTFNNGDKVRYVGPDHTDDDPTVYTVYDVLDKSFRVRWNDQDLSAIYGSTNAHFFELIEQEVIAPDDDWVTVDENDAKVLRQYAARLNVEFRTVTQYRVKYVTKED